MKVHVLMVYVYVYQAIVETIVKHVSTRWLKAIPESLSGELTRWIRADQKVLSLVQYFRTISKLNVTFLRRSFL